MTLLGILYAATVFLSSFLLFQIQPIIAKMILPWFGGSSSVWNTCMLFFQLVLLFGYAYAHWLQGRFTPRREALVHAGLLAVSLLALPIVANPAWKPAPGDNPALRILGMLTVTVGLPYFLVSTTSSLMQAWYARTHAGAVPYRLFALSNFASMLALLSYPLAVEPVLPVHVQGLVWSGGYVVFAILCASTAWLSANRKDLWRAAAPAPDIANDPAPPFRMRLLWVALAACASILLLSVTTFLTQDVAAVPFLWILPLAVYLLSFIVCFEAPRLYYRPVYIPLTIVALGAMAGGFAPFGWGAQMIPTIAIYVAGLFLCCMVCHGELVARKPHPRYLTNFYVMISLGGAIGGLFVGLVAPFTFDAYYEFPIGMAVCAALLAFLTPAWSKFLRPALGVLLCGYVVFLVIALREGIHDFRTVERNFYGQLRVFDEGAPEDDDYSRIMLHGVIYHGEQLLDEEYRRKPVAYFCSSSGIGHAMAALPQGVPRRIGILGLGCGTLAAYGRAGDTLRIYEINPLVPKLAQSQFTYLKDTAAKVEIVLGDGRLSLEREPDQQFDLLVMDAFSGDSVPVHLVTSEAFEMYFRHLKPGGLLAVNISNRYLDLRAVMERAASHFGKTAIYFSDTRPEDDFMCFSSSWVVIANPSIKNTSPELVAAGEIMNPRPQFRMWTDDFSNMWGILR